MINSINSKRYFCFSHSETFETEFIGQGHDEDKIISILQKTWVKMGKRGQDLALQMDLSDRAKELVGKALSG